MTIAAHQIRRTKNTVAQPSAPQPSAPASEPRGLAYDSADLPVLIRLPDLTNSAPPVTAPPERRTPAGDMERRQRHHRERKPARPQFSFSTVSPSSKYLTGAIAAGLVVVVLLFLTNGRTPPQDQGGGWDTQTELVVQEPEMAIPEPQTLAPATDKPVGLYPGFVYESPSRGSVQPAGNAAPPLYGATGTHAGLELASSETEVPLSANLGPREPESTPLKLGRADQSTGPVNAWPDEAENTAAPGASEETTNGNGSYVNPYIQGGYQSGLNTQALEAYRTGRLEQRSQSAPRESRQNILDGTIEIPPTTSIR